MARQLKALPDSARELKQGVGKISDSQPKMQLQQPIADRQVWAPMPTAS